LGSLPTFSGSEADGMTTKWVEFTGMDGLPVLISVDQITRVTPAAEGAGQKTEINDIGGRFFVQQDFAMVRQVLGQYAKKHT
jgi:hypothetical protein